MDTPKKPTFPSTRIQAGSITVHEVISSPAIVTDILTRADENPLITAMVAEPTRLRLEYQLCRSSIAQMLNIAYSMSILPDSSFHTHNELNSLSVTANRIRDQAQMGKMLAEGTIGEVIAAIKCLRDNNLTIPSSQQQLLRNVNDMETAWIEAGKSEAEAAELVGNELIAIESAIAERREEKAISDGKTRPKSSGFSFP